MSHKIRTPLNGIIGMIDLTLLSGLNSEQEENLLTAKSCANTLLHIINDILVFFKLESEKLEIESVDFNLKTLQEETIKAHLLMATNKGFEFNLFIFKPCTSSIKQLLSNLISNAIKFTEKGSVTLTVFNRNKTNEIAGLHFAVRDTGIRISHEDMGKLFLTFS